MTYLSLIQIGLLLGIGLAVLLLLVVYERSIRRARRVVDDSEAGPQSGPGRSVDRWPASGVRPVWMLRPLPLLEE